MKDVKRLVLLAALSGVGCSSPPPEATETPAAPASEVRLEEQARRRAGLEVVAVEAVEVGDEITVPGRVTLDEDRTVRVGSFIEGIVVECCRSVGSQVRQGESLATVHSHDTHELLASYRQAYADSAAREADASFAHRELERARRLYELKAGSLRQVQQAEVAAERTAAAMRSAAARLAGIRAHFEYLGVEPRGEQETGELPHLRVEVRSPIDGWVIDRMTTQGAVVTPSEPLYVVSDVSRVWTIAQVPEEQLRFIDLGMGAEIAVRAYPQRRFTGRVTQVDSELDPDSRTVQVRCEVPNPRRRLKAGMYAEVTLAASERRKALVVPLAALQRLEDEAVVFVAGEEGSFRPRRVETGREIGDRVEIVAGLDEGERVVAGGSFTLKSEMLVSKTAEE